MTNYPRIIFGVEGSDLADAISLALTAPPGQGIINELLHDGPYHEGVLKGFEQTKTDSGIICPWCKSQIVRYEYPQIGLRVLMCKEIGFFTPINSFTMTVKAWRKMVRKTATAWTGIEATKTAMRGGLS